MSELPDSISRGRLSALVDTLEIENEYATASLSMWGGHMLSFTPKHDQRERLFKSEKIVLDGTKSLRAGVPVCWPWFAQREGYQKHGYVRIRPWQILSATDTDEYTELVIAPKEMQGAGFQGNATLVLTVQIGKTLNLQLTTTNIGATAFDFQAALHTYFALDDVNQVELKGLSGTYSDKTRDWAMLETPDPYRFTEETDRIHLNPVKRVNLVEGEQQTVVESAGHDSIVVWNPWQENAKGMRDLTDDGYLKMLCVETAVTQGHTLEPSQTHTLTQVIS